MLISCPVCKKPALRFVKDSCKACYNKRWAKANRAHLREYHQAYRHSDMPGAVHMRAQSSEYLRRYRDGNETYAERHRADTSRRRVPKGAGEFVTISDLLFDHDDLCYLCGAPIESASDAHMDHVIPIARGGTHTRDNLAPAHARCNQIKRGLHPDAIPLHIQSKLHAELVRRFGPPNWPM